MKSKNAMEMQFHWIFVLIAGALIIAFFFSIGLKQKSYSAQKLSYTLENTLEAVITASLQSPGLSQKIPMPQPGIAFYCSKGCDCRFIIGDLPGGKGGNSFKEKIIFAPELVKEQDMTFFTLEWKMPFRAANFIYITNPSTKYHIIYSEGVPPSKRLKEMLEQSMPSAVNAEFVKLDDFSGITRKTFEHTRIVFLAVDEQQLDDSFSSAKNVDGVKIEEDQVIFLQKRKGEPVLEQLQGISYVPGDKAAVFAAVFAADKDMFSCGMREAYKRLALVSDVYARRMESLSNSLSTRCAYNAPMQQMVETSKTMSSQLQPETTTLSSLKLSVETANDKLVRQSCPPIY